MALNGVCLAPADVWNEADPTWQRIDTTYKVQRWEIDRGRVFEFDRTDTGTARIDLVDDTGAFDPTNLGATFANLTLRQAGIALQNPVDSTWSTLFRGYVQRVEWVPYQHEQFANVQIYLVDALALLAATEMAPDGTFGNSVTAGNIVFAEDLNTTAVQTRINNVLDQWGSGWPSSLREIFTGNVKLWETVYAPRTVVLNVIQDAADAEFPGVANVFVAKDGTIVFHGRFARFNYTDPQYRINQWQLGDDVAAIADPTNVVRISPPLAASMDDVNLFTSALATNQNIADADIAAQYTEDTVASGIYGLRTWSAENLLTAGGDAGATAEQETAKFAAYYKQNYWEPKVRCGAITIRPQKPTGIHGAACWELMSQADISDHVQLTTTHVGGGGFNQGFFVEGIHYQARPMNAQQHEVTLTLDVSPDSYFDSDPF
jgi:hypothetical protein